MICTCDFCHFTFESPRLPNQCPDCGKKYWRDPFGHWLGAVRKATDEEKEEYAAEKEIF